MFVLSQDMCAELQCQLPGSSEPVTNHVPALDGTKCGIKRGVSSLVLFKKYFEQMSYVHIYDYDAVTPSRKAVP